MAEEGINPAVAPENSKDPTQEGNAGEPQKEITLTDVLEYVKKQSDAVRELTKIIGELKAEIEKLRRSGRF